jgi:AraC-like DNA-binding protein
MANIVSGVLYGEGYARKIIPFYRELWEKQSLDPLPAIFDTPKSSNEKSLDCRVDELLPRVLSAIQAGNVPALRDLTRELVAPPLLPKTSLRASKVKMIGAMGSAFHVAQESGASRAYLDPLYGRFLRSVDEVDSPLLFANSFSEILSELAITVMKGNQVGSSVKVRLMDKYLHEHFREKLDIIELAGTVGLSPSYASTLFKLETGKTISERVLLYRVEAAEEMLIKTDKNVAEIAALVGFPLPNYFAKMFKRITGRSPRDYRKKISKI